MADRAHESSCPSCGHAVSVTLATEERGDQIAAERTRCPGCGAVLERAVAGHADHGWRLGEQSTG